MSLAFGVKDVVTYAYERTRRPAMLQKHGTEAFKRMNMGETLYVGVTDASGGWTKENMRSFSSNELMKFLDWVAKRRHDFLMEDSPFVAEARFIILIVREFFDAKDPCHEEQAFPDDKGFFRILREEQYEPLET